jgi:hypothetical protein
VNLYECLVGIYAKYEHTILLGDFNINLLDMEAPATKFLFDSFIEPFSLTQLIEQPTRITNTSSTLIDLILVNKPQNVLFSGTCDAPGISDHSFTYLVYSLKKEKFKPYTITRRDFKNIDIIKFNEEVEFMPWENVMCVSDINSKVTILENLINSVMDKHAPFKTFTITKKGSTPWINDNIRKLMDARDNKKFQFNETGDHNFFEEYKVLRNKVTSMRRTEQTNMFQEHINNNVDNTKEFYKAAVRFNVIPPKNEFSHVHFPANQLNDAFVSNNNATIDENLIDDRIRELYTDNPPCLHKFQFEPTTETEVNKIVHSLKTNSCGVDNINSKILKLLINRISPIITHIINISFEQNIFPERWKAAIIKPIPKIPFPLNEMDYRPISLLCTLSKIIEKIANKQICQYLAQHSLLDPYQSAYKSNHSCATAHLKITEDILDGIDDSEVALLVLLDFSKAFDTVNHKLLLEKLSILGFQENAVNWLKSYLSDRKQRVKTDNDLSDWKSIINGVPQGSILGPLLFTILVSDIRRHIYDGSYQAYADDLQTLYTCKPSNVGSMIPKVNSDLDRIAKYCKKSGLKINESKCFYMFIGSRQSINTINQTPYEPLKINDTPIKRVSHARNLGLTYDEILSWRKHVNICIAKAMANFINIARYKKFLSMKAKKTLCESLVLSQFNFCDSVYLNIDFYLIKKIQRIQNICIRFIFNIKKKDKCDYNDLRQKLDWLDMLSRRICHSLTILFKILKYKQPVYLSDMFTLNSEINNRLTRTYEGNIWIGNAHYSVIHRKAFRIYISRVWNSLPTEAKLCNTVNTFKNHIKQLFMSNSFQVPIT